MWEIFSSISFTEQATSKGILTERVTVTASPSAGSDDVMSEEQTTVYSIPYKS